jgi:hypothetical protein
MAFAPALVDSFTRADSDTLGTASPGPGTWTEQIYNQPGDLDIISNAVGATAANSSARLSGNVQDPQVALTIPTKQGNGTYIALYFRIQSPGGATTDAYELQMNALAGTDDVTAFRVIDAGFTSLGAPVSGSAVQEWSVGDKFGGWCAGTGATVTLVCLRDSGSGFVELCRWEDTNALRITATGLVGFELGDTVARVDDFSVADGPLEATPIVTKDVYVSMATEKQKP